MRNAFGVLFAALVLVGAAQGQAASVEGARQMPVVPTEAAEVASQPTKPIATNRTVADSAPSPAKATEFIDLTRLVLESARDQAATTSAQIERATTLILAFFAILGVGGGALGWSKLRDMKQSADKVVTDFAADMDRFRGDAASLSEEFKKSLENSMKELRAETNARIELLTARAEIAIAEKETDPKERGIGLASAVERIEKALQAPDLPGSTKIKALADLAYAKKRHGDRTGAFERIKEAAELARDSFPTMLPLLAYNAACYAVLLGRADAKSWLAEAIQGGEHFRDSACADEDFKSVHDQPWFVALIKKTA